VLTVLIVLIALSWTLRPPSHRTSRRTATGPLAAAVDTPGLAHTIRVIGHGGTGAGEVAAGADTPRKER
jgi:hypothetical protein